MGIICAITGNAQERETVPYMYDCFPYQTAVYFERQYIFEKDEKGVQKEVKLEQGNYLIDNEDMHFEFSINNNKELEGKAINKIPRTNRYYNIYYRNGYVIAIEGFYDTSSKTKFYDAYINRFVAIITNYFEDTGQIHEKEVLYKNGYNRVMSKYYKNGQLEYERNQINKYFISYYENGLIERFSDDENGFHSWYDINGNFTERRYNDKTINGSCEEKYENGIIIKKECTSFTEEQRERKEKITYLYDDKGNLDYYYILNLKTDEIKKYNSEGKEIEVYFAPKIEIHSISPH